MFRVTTSILNARRLLLFRSVHPVIQHAALSRSPSQYNKVREPCPKPPPPPPPKHKEDPLLWGTLALLVLTGAFVVYAKTDPEVRDWLSLHAPWLDDIIAVAHQETMTYSEFAEKCAKDAKKAITKLIKPSPPICDEKGNRLPNPVEENPKCLVVKERQEGDYVLVDCSDLADEAECNIVPAPILTKDICEIEHCLKDLGESAINNYMTARDACCCYNNQVEDTMTNFSMSKLKKLHHATKERLEMVKVYTEDAECASAKLEELSRYFECGVQAPKDAVKNTKDLLNEFHDKIKTMRIQWQWENDKAIALDAHWKKVETLMDKYTQENVQMTKDLNYMCKKPQLKGDADLLLIHTLRYVEQLKIEVNEARLSMSERISRGFDTLVKRCCDGKVRNENLFKEREANIQAELKKKQASVDAEFKKRADDKKADNEKYAKEALVKLTEQQQKNLELKLELKTIEANKKLEKLVAEHVELERQQMATEKAGMALKLKVVEDKLEARLKAERETRRSQELWSAGYALLAATKKGEPCVKVDKEIKAIEKASGDGDKLVMSVLRAIPDSVKKKGVVPESVIRERYHVMEDVALKVALVEEDGAPLPIFILSYIQSLLLFMKIPGIPQKEFEKPPKEPAKNLDTFDLLQRARFWIDRGDIAGALKYVNALEGASKAAAANWFEAARSHLETRQAAEAVLAHAAALGLQYV